MLIFPTTRSTHQQCWITQPHVRLVEKSAETRFGECVAQTACSSAAAAASAGGKCRVGGADSGGAAGLVVVLMVVVVVLMVVVVVVVVVVRLEYPSAPVWARGGASTTTTTAPAPPSPRPRQRRCLMTRPLLRRGSRHCACGYCHTTPPPTTPPPALSPPAHQLSTPGTGQTAVRSHHRLVSVLAQ